MSLKFNYTVAPHLEEFNVPFPTFHAARPEFAHFVGGGLIFSRTVTAAENQDNDSHPEGKRKEAQQPLRVLLLQRSYEDSYGGHWEGPSGSCEPEDETLLAGVAREVFEESGLHVSRFVEFVAMDKWPKVRPDRVDVIAKFTFIVEVHEARPAIPIGGENGDEQSMLPADKLEDGVVVPGLSRRWEDEVKLDPAEHRAFEWATEEEVRDSVERNTGKFVMLGHQGSRILEAFQILNARSEFAE